MRVEAEFEPMWAVPPGRTISDLMAVKGVTASGLARLMGMPTEDFEGLLSGEDLLTMDTATRLEQELGASTEFWLVRERQYREQLSKLVKNVDPRNCEYKSWLKKLPIKHMRELGWVDSSSDMRTKLNACLEFFDVPNLEAWYRTYGTLKAAAAFRTTDAYVESIPATAAWLRQGEIEADRIPCGEWNPRFFNNQLREIKRLTRIPDPSDFLPKLHHICAESGVAVVILKSPSGCRASGATFFSTPNKAVLLLSLRYLSDDQFWFSFFHEAAHLILHWQSESLILEVSGDERSPLEDEANQFAAEQLIPQELHGRMAQAAKSLKGIVRLARDAGVSNGIVVGQMQHLGLIEREHFNKLKIRYRWS